MPKVVEAIRASKQDSALKAMRRGDYAVAYSIWQPLAQAGDAQAQYSIGWMYHNGYGLAIDDHAAVRWWQRAAAQGHVEADFSLGMLYSLGSAEVEPDLDKAFDYYIRAASAGHEDTQLLLREWLGHSRTNPRLSPHLKTLLRTKWHILGEPLVLTVARGNLRTGPSTRYRIKGVLTRGSELVELNRRGKWVKVGVGGTNRVGWVHTSLVAEPKRVAGGANQ